MMDIQDLPLKTRRNSFQLHSQLSQNSENSSTIPNIVLTNPPQRSNSYDNIREKQATLTMNDNTTNYQQSNDSVEQNQRNSLGNQQEQQYQGKNQIISLVNDTQSVISKMDKISVLLESQKLLRKLHKELENIVLRHKQPFRKFDPECKLNSLNGKKHTQYKEMKSRSRSRSKEKKKGSKNRFQRCYSPEQKMQKYLKNSIICSRSSILKYNQMNNCQLSTNSNNRYSRYDQERDNMYLSSSDSNSPQLLGSNDIDEDEKGLNIKLEGINFKSEYSPPPQKGRGYGYFDSEKKKNSNKILFYLNKLEERSEEEEEQDQNMENKEQNGKKQISKYDKSRRQDDSYDSYTTKHEIEQLNEILKNLSIDIHNEVIKVQQEQQLETEEDTEIMDQNISTQSSMPNYQNNSCEMKSMANINKPNISSETIFTASASSPTNSQKYKFRSVEAGMDYVIRKLQNL